MIPLIGEMSAKQTKGCPNSENFAPAVNSHRTPRREQAPAPPCKLYFVRVGAIHESPAVSAPSERGLSNAQHLTGGEIFPFLSPSVTPYGVPPPSSEGGIPGRRVVAPYTCFSPSRLQKTREKFNNLPPSFAYGKSHPLTAAVSLCRFATSPSHCEGVYPNKRGGLRNGQDRSLRL